MRTLYIAMFLSLCLAAAAVSVESINSVDLSQNSNQVFITLSGAAEYNTQVINGGLGIRITIPNVGAPLSPPSYPRLSKVLDTVTAYREGQNAVIEIKTMQEVPITHSANAAKTRITVSLNATKAAEPKPEVRKPDPKPIPQTTVPLPPDTPVSNTDAQPAKPDTTMLSATLDTLAIAVAEGTDTAEPESAPPTKPSRSWLIYLIAGAALLLCLLIYWLYIRRKPQAETEEVPERKLEGPTLLFDSETRQRMVHKLLEQGWTAKEIAREMKLSLRDVEIIVAKLGRNR